MCQLVLLKLRARLGLRRYPTELLAVADVSDRELRAAESGAPSCTTVEASARPWGRQCFPIRQLAEALVMTVSSLFRVLVRSPICLLIRSLSAESRSSSSGPAVHDARQQIQDRFARQPCGVQLLDQLDTVDCALREVALAAEAAVRGEQALLLVVPQRPNAGACPGGEFANTHDGSPI